MRRRTLDIVFSTGGAVVAGMLLVLGLVLASNASFAKTYVADQLGEQQITFKPAEALTPEEAQSACLVEHAGQVLTTGKQAECYANDFIGLHLKQTANAEGHTYATIGGVQRELAAQVAAAEEAGDPAVAEIQQQLADVNVARETLFKGETLRGLLLTTYGFSIFGEKAALAANVLYLLAGILALLAIAGFAHAFATPPDRRVKIPGVVAEPNGHGDVEPVEIATPKKTVAKSGVKAGAGAKRPAK